MTINLPAFHVAEQVLVVTLRLFASTWVETRGHDQRWRGGLRAAHVAESGIDAFGDLFGVIALSAKRQLGIHGPQCSCVGDDEVAFLRLVSLIQRGQTEDAADLLGDWLPAAAVRLAMFHAGILGVALKQRGLILPLRNFEVAEAYGSPFVHANIGLTLVQ